VPNTELELIQILFVVSGATAPQWARDSSFRKFLYQTQRTAVGRTPLDEWSALRGDLYLTTHNNHNRQTFMPPGGIQTHNLSRQAAVDLRLRLRSQLILSRWWKWWCRYPVQETRELSSYVMHFELLVWSVWIN